MKAYMYKKVTEVFGKEYKLDSTERLLGGTQKHTFLAKCLNGFEFVIYQWGKGTSYFENNNENAIFCSSSAELFQRNNELMRNHGVFTPKLFYMDRSKQDFDFEYAFVEYINGHDIDYIMKK